MDNNFVDGQWVGSFIIGDRVIYTSRTDLPPKEGRISHCFGGGNVGGYRYVITFSPGCYAHCFESDLQAVETTNEE